MNIYNLFSLKLILFLYGTPRYKKYINLKYLLYTILKDYDKVACKLFESNLGNGSDNKT